MAGAFVGVADDATAVYWNPAGLATGPLFSLAVEHERLETIPDASPASEAFSGNATLVALSTPPLGVSYYRLASHALRPRDRPVGTQHGEGRCDVSGVDCDEADGA